MFIPKIENQSFAYPGMSATFTSYNCTHIQISDPILVSRMERKKEVINYRALTSVLKIILIQ